MGIKWISPPTQKELSEVLAGWRRALKAQEQAKEPREQKGQEKAQ